MASDAYPRLSRLLLLRSDRHPIGTVSGADSVGHDVGVVREFEQLGLLTRARDLRDAGDVVFHPGDGGCWATLVEGADLDAADPLALVCYEIDFVAIGRLLRSRAKLEGPPIEEVGHLAMFLGARAKGRRRQYVYLVRALRPARALDVLLAIRAHAGPDVAIIVLTPTSRELPRGVIKQVDGVHLLAISDLLRRGSIPFALTLPALPSTAEPRNRAVRLSIDGGGHLATLDGTELRLEIRDFRVLQLLATEAAEQGGFVTRELIGRTLRQSTSKEDSNEEQIDKSIHRIREALGTIVPSACPGLIETKRKVGYRLTLAKGAISVF